MFDTQIVVTGRLEVDSHSPLRILSMDAGKEDVRRFLQEISDLKTPGDRNNADAVLQVSISANCRLYEDLRRESLICEALEDLMKDVIEEKVEKRIEERVSQAVSQAVKLNTEQVTEQKDKEMTVKLFERGTSMDTIAELVGRSVDVIRQWVAPVHTYNDTADLPRQIRHFLINTFPVCYPCNPFTLLLSEEKANRVSSIHPGGPARLGVIRPGGRSRVSVYGLSSGGLWTSGSGAPARRGSASAPRPCSPNRRGRPFRGGSRPSGGFPRPEWW